MEHISCALIAHTWDFPMSLVCLLSILSKIHDTINKTSVFERVYSENHQELRTLNSISTFAVGVLSIEKAHVESKHAQLMQLARCIGRRG